MQTFVLIHTTVGKAEDVARAVAELDHVETAEAVTGPYDVVVRMEAESLDEVVTKTLPGIQRIGGVTRTIACPVVGHRYSWVDRMERIYAAT